MVDTNDLSQLKDDMTAFIEGHGMRRFPAYVGEDVTSIQWDNSDPESWKDFVELARNAGATFLSVNDVVLTRDDVDYIFEQLSGWASQEQLSDARDLYAHIGRTGFVQLGWPHQGLMFVYEASADWYDSYQGLMELADDSGGWIMDTRDLDEDDER